MNVDLSVALGANTPVYPGDPAMGVEPVGVFERDGWTDHLLHLGTHVGTHIDAPAHMVPGGKTLDAFGLERFIGRGVLIDATAGFDVDAVRAAEMGAGDIVVFHTGMSKRFAEPTYFTEHPAMSPETAELLAERGVSMVGVDAGSVDNTDGFPIHKILLENEVLIIENLAPLDLLLGRAFTVFALPLKVDLDGAPARVVAQTG